MNAESKPGSGWCNLCKPPSKQRFDRIVEHLREVHGWDEELETWPDGVPIVIDSTLEPADFRSGADEPERT